jgi:hypothetical protein
MIREANRYRNEKSSVKSKAYETLKTTLGFICGLDAGERTDRNLYSEIMAEIEEVLC